MKVEKIYLTHPERLLRELAGRDNVALVTVVPDVTGDGARVYLTLAEETR